MKEREADIKTMRGGGVGDRARQKQDERWGLEQ